MWGHRAWKESSWKIIIQNRHTCIYLAYFHSNNLRTTPITTCNMLPMFREPHIIVDSYMHTYLHFDIHKNNWHQHIFHNLNFPFKMQCQSSHNWYSRIPIIEAKTSFYSLVTRVITYNHQKHEILTSTHPNGEGRLLQYI